MSDTNEPVNFIFNLDTKEFIEKVFHSKEAVLSLGESKNLEGLVKGMMKATAVVGTLGVAFLAVHTAFEAVMEAEQIKAINNQFEVLTENVGINAAAFKERLMVTAKGLATESDLLAAANKGMVEFGGGAEGMVKTLDLARKVTASFGGDMVENFEKLNQAIAFGNQRALKQMNIVVDVQKAYKDYAHTLGVMPQELSKAGEQQALLNAVVQSGEKNLKTANSAVKEGTITWKQFKVDLKEIGEAITLAFDKFAGPAIKEYIKNLKEFSHFLKEKVIGATADFAESAEVTEVQMKQSTQQIYKLNKELIDLKEKQDQAAKGFGSMTPEAYAKRIEKVTAELVVARGELKGLHEASKKFEEGKEENPEAKTKKDPLIDREAHLKAEAKFHEDLAKIKEASVQQQLKNSTDIGESEKLVNEQIGFEHEKLAAQKQAINQEYGENSTRARELNAALDEQQAQKDLEREDRVHKAKMDALDKLSTKNRETAAGMGNAMEAGSLKAKMALSDFSARGDFAFKSLGKHSKQAFIDMGAGAKTGAEAMKGFMFNVLADMAEQEGEMRLLAGIWPPNPASLAAGAGLLALSGYLRSQAGGGSSGGGSSGGGGGGMSGPVGSSMADMKPGMEETKKKTMTVSINGPLYGTDETNRWLMERIREASDATDFNLVKVGES